jgi:phage-related protein
MDGVVEAEVTFDTKPFWYIDNDIEVNNSPNGREFVLQNPTGFLSYPKITVRVNLHDRELDFSFTDNSSNVQSFSIPPSPYFGDVEVVYDSKTGDVTIDGQSYNYLISNFNRPPVFSIGQNKITINQYHGNTIPYILIEPRWRML